MLRLVFGEGKCSCVKCSERTIALCVSGSYNKNPDIEIVAPLRSRWYRCISSLCPSVHQIARKIYVMSIKMLIFSSMLGDLVGMAINCEAVLMYPRIRELAGSVV